MFLAPRSGGIVGTIRYSLVSRVIPYQGRISTVIPRRTFSHTLVSRQELIKAVKPKSRKKARSKKASLIQSGQDGTSQQGISRSKPGERKVVTAYCVAQEYDMHHVNRILNDRGMQAGSSGSLLYPDEPEVIHIEMPISSNKSDISHMRHSESVPTGDVFIFPSGTIVSWGVPRPNIEYLAVEVLSAAAKDSLGANAEDENLEYTEDANEDRSSIRGEMIVLGTKEGLSEDDMGSSEHESMRVILSKIAFSSGLARATKLSVLENLVDEYSQSSRAILSMLSGGPLTRMKSRRWVYQRLSQLLDLRAQLNLYSELADDLPDLFWESKQELGLEIYYDQVGRVLDVLTRIKILNQKMDYAEEIIRNLRDMRSEIHSSRLEWIIIWLITFEVLHTVWIEVWRIPQEREKAKEEVSSTRVSLAI